MGGGAAARPAGLYAAPERAPRGKLQARRIPGNRAPLPAALCPEMAGRPLFAAAPCHGRSPAAALRRARMPVRPAAGWPRAGQPRRLSAPPPRCGHAARVRGRQAAICAARGPAGRDAP